MNVFLFQAQFEPLILDGTKLHTIRAPRRDGRPRANVGEVMSLRCWRGLPYRSKQREFAQAKVWFTGLVMLTADGVRRLADDYQFGRDWIARSDGFETWADMRDWFAKTHGLPFEGELVGWEKLEATD